MRREKFLELIKAQLRVHPICAILGPRQVGKTTLAKMYIKEYAQNDAYFFDLENPLDVALLENPTLALKNITETYIVIDEIQRRPDLFEVLRVLVDDENYNKKFLILGSASRDLIKQSSETLAGRIGYVELPPFTLFETNDMITHWVRGGFPRSYLSETIEDSVIWRESYISTFLERDIPALGFAIPAEQMRRFWLMLVHYHGQIFNASELARSLNVSDQTTRRYLDILAGTFMIRILPAWFENLKKRQIKSPKIYFRDSGLLHTLVGIQNKEQLFRYAKLGAFWEGYALEEIIRTFNINRGEYYFWSAHSGAEIDLFVIKNGKRIGFECKYSDSPRATKSMHTAIDDLKLDTLIIIYPGDKTAVISEKIHLCGIESINSEKLAHILL